MILHTIKSFLPLTLARKKIQITDLKSFHGCMWESLVSKAENVLRHGHELTLYYIHVTGATYLRRTIFFKVGWYDSMEVVGGRWVETKAKTLGLGSAGYR